MGTDPTVETVGLPDKLANAIGRRLLERGQVYHPWWDLSKRTGVKLEWHNGRVGNWDSPHAVTDFNELSITFHVGLTENQMRSTLTHELVHLDRGPLRGGKRVADEEKRVDTLAAQRLIDPVLWDLLDGIEIPRHTRLNILRADSRMLRVYSQWRSRVTRKTATARFEAAAEQYPTWPAPWMHDEASRWRSLPNLSAALAPTSTEMDR